MSSWSTAPCWKGYAFAPALLRFRAESCADGDTSTIVSLLTMHIERNEQALALNDTNMGLEEVAMRYFARGIPIPQRIIDYSMWKQKHLAQLNNYHIPEHLWEVRLHMLDLVVHRFTMLVHSL